MTSTITDRHRKIDVTEVRDVIITSIVQDGGTYTRSIRILGNLGGPSPGEVIELVLSSSTRADIELTAPTYEF